LSRTEFFQIVAAACLPLGVIMVFSGRLFFRTFQGIFCFALLATIIWKAITACIPDVRSSLLTLWMVIFGICGYRFGKYDSRFTPRVLGFVNGTLMARYLFYVINRDPGEILHWFLYAALMLSLANCITKVHKNVIVTSLGSFMTALSTRILISGTMDIGVIDLVVYPALTVIGLVVHLIFKRRELKRKRDEEMANYLNINPFERRV
jgi:TctA family transporter